MEFYVGQKLWCAKIDTVWRERTSDVGREVTITKVGSKWLTVDNPRGAAKVDKETMLVDGGRYSPTFQCHLSQEAHQKKLALGVAWNALRNRLGSQSKPPPDCTTEMIDEAIRIVFGENAIG